MDDRIWSILEEIARSINNTNLAIQISHARLLSRTKEKQEHDRYVNQLADEVMKRIDMKLSTGDALNQLKELNKAISQLGK